MAAMSTIAIILMSFAILASMRSAEAAACTSSGRTHAKLLQAEQLPSVCLPSSDDFTGQAVFQCLQSWKISYSNCKVVMTPDLPYSSSGLPCRFFSSQGNITGDHTAHVHAVVDRDALLAFLLENPRIAERLNGGDASAPASSREVAENLVLALHSFFHHSKSHKNHHAAPLKTATTAITPRRSSADDGGARQAASRRQAAAAQADPAATTPGTLASRRRQARRLLLLGLQHLEPKPQQLASSTASASFSASAAVASSAAVGRPASEATAAAGADAGPAPTAATGAGGGLLAGRHAESGADGLSAAEDDPAEVSRSGSSLYFASMDSCVYVYRVKRHSKFLNPEPAPGPRTSQDNPAVTASCIVGITTMLAAAIWFAAARVQAIRQSEIADALLLQQEEQQRAAAEAAAARRAARSASTRSRSSTDSGSLTAPLLEGEVGEAAAPLAAAGDARDVEQGGAAAAAGVGPGAAVAAGGRVGAAPPAADAAESGNGDAADK